MQADGCQRTQVHPEGAVTVEDKDLTLRERKGDSQADRRAQTESLYLDVAVARPHPVPFRSGAPGGGDKQLIFDQRDDGFKTFVTLHRSPDYKTARVNS